ncbi:hypothetical protein GHK86_10135 [Acidimicrobiaceae bacterium USS-CC1]|uniref:Uncharacterized protein n=1 Tax=Acidiferrimicrobium australe TaxID=2664430 RepID=A0ABW9QTA3_9ACTN|nr:hypothetical protein [Acidiferrimicrobium australe]
MSAARQPAPCARPDCPNPVIRPARRGRPPIYCSPARRAQAQRRPPPEPILVEVDHGSLTAHRRPAGRVWLVRLRRGPHAVTVASGLGRTTADHRAAQIITIIANRSTPAGAAID